MLSFQAALVLFEIPPIRIVHVSRIGSHQSVRSIQETAPELLARRQPRQMEQLGKLVSRQQCFDKYFRVVYHVKATQAFFILVEHGHMGHVGVPTIDVGLHAA